MKLYIMRHGQAQITASSDSARQLTPQGHQETEIMAKWLRSNEQGFDLTFVSPYVRAKQTFDNVINEFVMPEHHYELDELTPDSNPQMCGDALLAYCAQHKANSALVVSHLPLVGLLVNDLCRGDLVPAFATSSIACLDIDLESWQGNLLWHKTVNQVLMGA
ncbi:phosphohistidine phosphatase SixA [Psychrobium sp. MM17-31]|uniref:phosphohistidine phosphatase SixA n=1 Tax=Psychrobium sp. MM17-31 TaxID=2917758 RepID=UPI001EF496C7|nr:phosphohistidine phosphatase SixA [Psychrobium sp. MM17-31]MCG7531715.1 phosphohistidine phosphatase SixA [Psychrobium sp. MM17-31]